MADAKPGVHASSLRPVQVPEALVKGDKFIKWDEESASAMPVTLRVDSNAYFLYWRDQNGEVDCLDIALIRDARCARNAKSPKDIKIQNLCNAIGSVENNAPIGERTLTIVYGLDLINLQWLNFVASSADIVKEWSTQIFSIATNILAKYPSFYQILQKMWTKFSILTTYDGTKVQIKHIYKTLANHKDDKKRVERALQSCQWPAIKTESINVSEFTFDRFLKFYKTLSQRNEFVKICEDLNFKKKPYMHMTTDQFVNFLNEKQRDPRLNEILYPYANHVKAKELIQKYEPSSSLIKEGHLSPDGLQAFLMSSDNAVIPLDALDLSQDMDQPLAHYFINSSHNTYLTGHQLTGKSSVELYRQVLLTGCRCVELDCWDGKGEDLEPIITHGYTMCTEISFRDVIDAIVETAFKSSEFPVILSFENHCSQKQQATMVQIIKEKIGDRVLKNPLDSHPLEPNVPLPSPSQLKGYFLIKNKRRQFKKGEKQVQTDHERLTRRRQAALGGDIETFDDDGLEEELDLASKQDLSGSLYDEEKDEEDYCEDRDETEDVTTGIDERCKKMDEKDQPRVGDLLKEPLMHWEISAMVNYIEPAPFYSFESALKKNVSYECCSFAETQATNLLKEQPVEFVNFNKRQISRIYPKGTRVDSGNYMPQLFWNAGCQLVALNFQTLDLALQLNLGIFEYQMSCGYILKPDFMRRPDRRFDPFAESTVDGIVANTLSIQIISGLFLSDKRVGTYVEVDMYGLPADTVRKRFRTKIVPANGINPVYAEEAMVFKKVVLPALAVLRLTAYEETGKFIGHRILPVNSLRPGYKHIPLRNEANMPLTLPTLFVHISVKDYVPDAFADFAAALSNPIAYAEKHSQQLSVLTDDFDDFDVAKEPTISSECQITSEDIAKRKTTFGVDESTKRINAEPSSNPKPISRTGTILSAGRSHAIPGAVNSAPSTSAGFSQQRASVNIKANDIESAQFTKKSMLNESACLPKLTLDDLRDEKKCVKIILKMNKDMEALAKKNEKAVEQLKEKQTNAIQQVLSSFGRNNREKRPRTPSRSLHLSPTHGSAANLDLSVEVKEELHKKLAEKKVEHKEEIRSLLKEHANLEMELRSKAQKSFYDEMELTLTAVSTMQLRKLTTIYENELAVLRKLQDETRKHDMRDMAKKHKDKQELARVKRELSQKHISSAVSERQQLKDLHEKREKELHNKLQTLKSELEAEKIKAEENCRLCFEQQVTKTNDLDGEQTAL